MVLREYAFWVELGGLIRPSCYDVATIDYSCISSRQQLDSRSAKRGSGVNREAVDLVGRMVRYNQHDMTIDDLQGSAVRNYGEGLLKALMTICADFVTNDVPIKPTHYHLRTGSSRTTSKTLEEEKLNSDSLGAVKVQAC